MTAAIELVNLSHRYADGRVALTNVNLHIAPGERVGLIGANGAGKSTLFLRLVGVLPGKPGEARVVGLDPALASSRSHLPRHVGIVFQSPDDQLFAPTLRDDVMFGPLNLGVSPKDAEAQAMEALGEMGLAGFAHRAPDRLSGGEKRKAALAGVLAMRPAIVLLDEPTVFLDPRGRRDLLERLQTLTATIVVATHELGFVRALCDRVILLGRGGVVADGPMAHILGDEALLDREGLLGPS